jgi:hypothetical protein
MPIFLEPVEVPERCYLEEVLMWVAFQRLPTAWYTLDGKEIRESDDIDGYQTGIGTALSEDETSRAGIPIDPDLTWDLNNWPKMPLAHCEEYLARNDLEDDDRRAAEEWRDYAVKYEQERAAWQPLYDRAIEYPASRIFIALREGRLRARGRLLPHSDYYEAVALLEGEGRDIVDITPTDIPASFWSLQGIDFDGSTALDGSAHYCHITCRTEEVLAVFPGDRAEVHGIERIGDTFVLNEGPTIRRTQARRGRPPYAWDQFHLEVASLLHRGKLPAKKEAAIEHLQGWFQKELGVRPSWAAVGDKLKPYYEKFVRPRGR